jgi:hypothetical protein
MKTREDWICEQLDKDNLDATLRLEYEAELDVIADRYSAIAIRKKEADAKELTRREEIRIKILANDIDFINHLGQEEFGADYEIIEEASSFIVYSHVAKDDQENRRVHATLEKAEADLRYLLYNRLYSRYVRTGEIDSLIELAAA